MKRISGGAVQLSPTDLSSFLACRHKTALDLSVVLGLREVPAWKDSSLIVLQERGKRHETEYAGVLKAEGLSVVDLEQRHGDDAVGATIKAMKDQADVILQGALRYGGWYGMPDVLRRVSISSAFGNWSYEVEDGLAPV